VTVMHISKNKRQLVPDNRGFTLIEVLVSLAIFAMGIIACYTMQMRSASTAGRADSVAASSTWASYLIEDFMSLKYDDPLLDNDAGNAANGFLDIDDTAAGTPDGVRYIRPDGTVASAAAAGDLYSIYWNIAEDRPLDGVKQVRVTVVKNDGLNAGVLYSHDYFKSNENL